MNQILISGTSPLDIAIARNLLNTPLVDGTNRSIVMLNPPSKDHPSELDVLLFRDNGERLRVLNKYDVTANPAYVADQFQELYDRFGTEGIDVLIDNAQDAPVLDMSSSNYHRDFDKAQNRVINPLRNLLPGFVALNSNKKGTPAIVAATTSVAPAFFDYWRKNLANGEGRDPAQEGDDWVKQDFVSEIHGQYGNTFSGYALLGLRRDLLNTSIAIPNSPSKLILAELLTGHIEPIDDKVERHRNAYNAHNGTDLTQKQFMDAGHVVNWTADGAIMPPEVVANQLVGLMNLAIVNKGSVYDATSGSLHPSVYEHTFGRKPRE